METLLKDIVIIFGLSVVVLLAGHKLGIPSIVGFLFTGVIAGPNGLGLVSGTDNVEVLANVGLVLLLFTIGMEVSLSKIVQYKRFFLAGGILQVILTIAAGAGAGIFIGRPFNEAVFLGFILSLSSTAIVMRVLTHKGEADTPHGHMSLGILIFQDIAAVIMMLLVPYLAGIHSEDEGSFAVIFLKGLCLVAFVILMAQYAIPKMLFSITKTRSRELFLLSVLTICFSVAYLTHAIGLSVSLGAFLAGLTVSESEYKNEAIGDMIPLEEIFTSFFFVSIGMLLDSAFFLRHPISILLITAGVLVMKSAVATVAGLLIGMPLRTSILSGIALSQIGEFSFVLAKAGILSGISDSEHFQLFLSVSLLTMASAPFLIEFSPWIAKVFLGLPFSEKLKSGFKPIRHKQAKKLANHIIIIGFGLCGRNIARAAREAGIPYTILEMNAETVVREQKNGEPIHFGDATHQHVLEYANLAEAGALAIVINDGVAAARIVELGRRLNRDLYIIVRTHYIQQSKSMANLGADEVISDEFGSSVEIFTRVLKRYLIPNDKIEGLVEKIRREGQGIEHFLRPSSLFPNLLGHEILVETFHIRQNSFLDGIKVGESGLRKNYGVNIMLIKRNKDIINDINAETMLQALDILVLAGTHENLSKITTLLTSKKQGRT